MEIKPTKAFNLGGKKINGRSFTQIYVLQRDFHHSHIRAYTHTCGEKKHFSR